MEIKKSIIEILRENNRLEAYSIKMKLDKKREDIPYNVFMKNLQDMRKMGKINVFPKGRSSSNKISGFGYSLNNYQNEKTI